MTGRLTRAAYMQALATLGQRDAALGGVLETCGPAPFWTRRPGFPTLLQIILEQQVSLASARVAFERLQALCTPLTPQGFLALDDAALLAAGFSRQKREYCRGLALAVENGDLNLSRLGRHDDERVREMLTGVRGIGRWTADIYLLMALRRGDIWPRGDLALLRAARDLYGARRAADDASLVRLARRWQPLRAVAARLLWHHYLSNRK